MTTKKTQTKTTGNPLMMRLSGEVIPPELQRSLKPVGYVGALFFKYGQNVQQFSEMRIDGHCIAEILEHLGYIEFKRNEADRPKGTYRFIKDIPSQSQFLREYNEALRMVANG